MAIRHFAIPEGPSVADPAWVVAVSEIHGPTEHVEYSDYTVIEELIAQCRHLQSKAYGRMEEAQRICALFGVRTTFQLDELAAAHRGNS